MFEVSSIKIDPARWLLCLLFFAALLAPNNLLAQQKPKRWADGELLVGLRSGVSQDHAGRLFKSHGAAVLEELQRINVHRLRVAGAALDAVEEALSRRPEVKFVERNGVVDLSAVPSDPMYESAWHLSRIGVPSAWDT